MIAGFYDITTKTLGKGHHGLVKLARHCLTGEPTAVKIIEKARLNCYSLQQLGSEIRILFALSDYEHPNILKLYQTIDTRDKLLLVTEYCGPNACDLHDYILSSRDGCLSQDQARIFFLQICSAISYCHSMGIVHRDLKPENILVADLRHMYYRNKYPLLKLIDFGFANHWMPDEMMHTSCGTLAYSAPELLLGEPYDGTKVDIWGLGVLLYILLYGSNPFMQINDNETLTKILDCSFIIPNLTYIDKSAIKLIRALIRRNPNERLKMNEILGHEWLNESMLDIENSNDCCKSKITLINTINNSCESKSSTNKVLISTKLATVLPPISEYGPLKDEICKNLDIFNSTLPQTRSQQKAKLDCNMRTRSLSITKSIIKTNDTLTQTKSSINLSSDYDGLCHSPSTPLKCHQQTSLKSSYHKLQYRPTSPDIRGLEKMSDNELSLHNQIIDEMFKLNKLIDSKSAIETCLTSARLRHRMFDEKSIQSIKQPNKVNESLCSKSIQHIKHDLSQQSKDTSKSITSPNCDNKEKGNSSSSTCPTQNKLSNDEYIYATYQLLRDRANRAKAEKFSNIAQNFKHLTASLQTNNQSLDGTVNQSDCLQKLSMSYTLPLARKCSLVSEEGGYTSDLAD